MRRWRTFRYKGLVLILGIFLVMGLILFTERSGIQYKESERENYFLEEDRAVTAREASDGLHPACLVIINSQEEASALAWEQYGQILLDMKVGYTLADVSKEAVPDMESFESVVVLLSDINPLKEKVLELASWVKDGGSALFALTIQKDRYAELIEQKLGVISSGYENTVVEKIYLDKDFMIGGGRSYTISDSFDSAWAVELGENVKVYAWTDDSRKVPLIWENQYGEGKFVVNNLGLYEKSLRGFYAASYSLLGDMNVWPVINGSAFYIDDFPSPVPSGDGTYIRRDYDTNIADFYTNIWWPDMISLAKEHGIKYTGAMIENYEDETDGVVEHPEDSSRFRYFGDMLLHQGGELGYHGYNHQPLCLQNVDYGSILPYKTWETYEAMNNAMTQLLAFGDEMFPGVDMSVYVPPSNVLSAEGRKMLAEDFPKIKTVASNFLTGELAYAQEFEVADDGIVEQPRIISGGIIDEYMEMAAVSELNMHFVNNHFLHPDDLLDEDRGAALGWEKIKKRLDEYMDWLYGAAPTLRNQTGSQLSGSIQRFAAVTVDREWTQDSIRLHLGNFHDEAYFLLRLNEGTPGSVTGGKLEAVTDNLYLLHATDSEITIAWDR